VVGRSVLFVRSFYGIVVLDGLAGFVFFGCVHINTLVGIARGKATCDAEQAHQKE
jgi:hypothetical protein